MVKAAWKAQNPRRGWLKPGRPKILGRVCLKRPGRLQAKIGLQFWPFFLVWGCKKIASQDWLAILVQKLGTLGTLATKPSEGSAKRGLGGQRLGTLEMGFEAAHTQNLRKVLLEELSTRNNSHSKSLPFEISPIRNLFHSKFLPLEISSFFLGCALSAPARQSRGGGLSERHNSKRILPFSRLSTVAGIYIYIYIYI